ncbi:MAG: PQQ-binding-like beta-propeller repeat protein [Spirochaetales bacterium]|nr:PQQ-binding-like beta-propeller repeat protein [Spirochaetales bacterium]
MVRKRRNKIFLYAIIVLYAFAFSLSCEQQADWIMFRNNQGQGNTPNNLTPPLAVRWKIQIQANEERATSFNSPLLKDDTIYFGAVDGNFYAFDLATGYMRWIFKTNGEINSTPYVDDEAVYFGSNDGKVYAVALEDGKQEWSFDAGSKVLSTVTRYEDYIVFCSEGGSSFFLNAEGILQFSMPNPVWTYYSFQVDDDVMYFAPGPIESPHSFGAFDIKNRIHLWVIENESHDPMWFSFPAVSDDKLYYAICTYGFYELTYNYYALDRLTGQPVWEIIKKSVLEKNTELYAFDVFYRNIELLDYMAPAVWNNLVIYTSGDTLVRAFHADTGETAWQTKLQQPTSSAPLVAGDRVYFGILGDEQGSSPRLICLSAANGSVMWEMETQGAILSAPISAGKWLVFGTDAYYFYVLEEVF